MGFADRIAGWFESGEARGKVLRWGWWISLLFLLFGYAVIFYTLF